MHSMGNRSPFPILCDKSVILSVGIKSFARVSPMLFSPPYTILCLILHFVSACIVLIHCLMFLYVVLPVYFYLFSSSSSTYASIQAVCSCFSPCLFVLLRFIVFYPPHAVFFILLPLALLVIISPLSCPCFPPAPAVGVTRFLLERPPHPPSLQAPHLPAFLLAVCSSLQNPRCNFSLLARLGAIRSLLAGASRTSGAICSLLARASRSRGAICFLPKPQG